jgi:hypothetical protein
MRRQARLFAAALLGEADASEYTIYNGGRTTKWYAYNGSNGKHVDLSGNTFSEAVDDFNARIGPYYESRGGWRYG